MFSLHLFHLKGILWLNIMIIGISTALTKCWYKIMYFSELFSCNDIRLYRFWYLTKTNLAFSNNGSSHSSSFLSLMLVYDNVITDSLLVNYVSICIICVSKYFLQCFNVLGQFRIGSRQLYNFRMNEVL